MKQIRWIPSIFICTFIFSQSMKTVTESAGISSSITEWIYPFFSLLEKDVLHFFIRKAAHFTEFFLLGISLLWPLSKNGKRFLLFCILVPLSDETIQLFIPGRSGQFSDCLIDAFGMAFAWICFQFYKKLKGGK